MLLTTYKTVHAYPNSRSRITERVQHLARGDVDEIKNLVWEMSVYAPYYFGQTRLRVADVLFGRAWGRVL
jgi:hypothetical protein